MTDNMDVSIYMALDTGAWLRNVQGRPVEERGAEISLEVAAWTSGGRLPNVPDRLRLVAGADSSLWATIWPAIADLWQVTEDGRHIYQPAMVEAIERARNARAAAVARGKESQRKQAEKRQKPAHAPASGGDGGDQGDDHDIGDQAPPDLKPSPNSLETVSKPSQECLEPPNSELRTPEGNTEKEHRETDTCPSGGPAGPVGGDVPVLTLIPGGEGPEGKARKPIKPDSVATVQEVFKHYFHKHHHPMRRRPLPTSKTWRAIAARLRDGWTVEELCRSIDGYYLSPWHQGQNEDGRKHLELELFMRDEEHVQRGIDMAENPPKGNTQLGRVGQARAEDSNHAQIGDIEV